MTTIQTTLQQPVERIVAGALFDLMAMLTCSKEVHTFSSHHDASPAVDVLKDFAAKRGLNLDEALVHGWNDEFASTSQPVQANALTDEQIKALWDKYVPPYMGLDAPMNFARALLASQPSATADVAQKNGDLIDWDRISEAAKQACNEYGQWMPERWLQLFVNAYNRKKS